jgi:hypothetical protein
MALGQQWQGSYAETFYGLAAVVGALAIASLVTPLPGSVVKDHQPAR